MKLTMSYLGSSGLRLSGSGQRILQMAPNLSRDEVAFDAPLVEPIRFREAISTLHDIVINDLTFQPRDKQAYEKWKSEQNLRETMIRQEARKEAREELKKRVGQKPSPQLELDYRKALKRYWKSRRSLNDYLRKQNQQLWRKLMPYDPVITVAEDVVFFECFSSDESSYGCLTVERDCFGASRQTSLGTTNVDYSWDLYDHFQSLRTYRETRFNIDPSGFEVTTENQPEYREEKIELPDGWLRGFMQLQSAMCLPMRRVPLSISCFYSLLAFLKRNKAKSSPRAVRFELSNGSSPAIVLEPWDKRIESPETKYYGPDAEPVRIWGRRRLLSLTRLLPLIDSIDVFLLGTGLPSFWLISMGNIRLTLGLSGWTANDWTRGSAVQMLLPPETPSDQLVATMAQRLNESRASSFDDLMRFSPGRRNDCAAAMNQLALRGQAIFDLGSGVFRWRQILPMPLSDRELGPAHPEMSAAKSLRLQQQFRIDSQEPGPRGGTILVGNVEGKPCETLVDGDGVVRKGKCVCPWHYKFGIRNGPCRHIQVLRDVAWVSSDAVSDDWYTNRLKWSGAES